jgi:tetratricopeptide (TPR) repeat protein
VGCGVVVRCRVVFIILSAFPLFAQNNKTAGALAAFQHGDFPAAERLLQTELHANPDDTPALEILAIVLDQQKKYTEADTLYRRALKLDPRSPALLNNFANHLIASGHPQEARPIFLRVLSMSPGHTNACMQLAQLALNQHSPAAAISFLDRLSSSDRERPAALVLRGEALSSEGQLRSAEAEFVQALEAAPGNNAAVRDLATVETTLEQFPDAARSWKRYLDAVPEDDLAQREYAFAESAIGINTDAALAALQSFVRNHPNDAMGYYELGAAESPVSPEKALTDLNRAITIKPNLMAARVARGLLLFRQTKPAQALLDFQAAVERRPDDARVLDRLGQTYTALNRFQEAVPVLRRAADLAPNDSSILLHLGLALSKTGKQDESKAVFARIRQLEAKAVIPSN